LSGWSKEPKYLAFNSLFKARCSVCCYRRALKKFDDDGFVPAKDVSTIEKSRQIDLYQLCDDYRCGLIVNRSVYLNEIAKVLQRL
jgi:hypothetical protein